MVIFVLYLLDKICLQAWCHIRLEWFLSPDWPNLASKIVGSNNFSAQFIEINSHYKNIGYNINVLQQTACLVVNPVMVGNFVSFVDILCFSVSCLLCLCERLFICALWSLAGKRADLLALVCGVQLWVVTFPLVSWVRCGTRLYRFLIFAPLLTFINRCI